MYQLILIRKNQIEVHWFKSENEIYSCISDGSINKYKIYPPNKNKNLFFVNSYYWDDLKKDFAIDLNIAKEIKRNFFRKTRSILFEKLDKAFLKAIEEDNLEKKDYIVNLKNQFRNITDLELPNDEQELIDFIPSVFKEVYDLNI
jgi:hypothetical protein